MAISGNDILLIINPKLLWNYILLYQLAAIYANNLKIVSQQKCQSLSNKPAFLKILRLGRAPKSE